MDNTINLFIFSSTKDYILKISLPDTVVVIFLAFLPVVGVLGVVVAVVVVVVVDDVVVPGVVSFVVVGVGVVVAAVFAVGVALFFVVIVFMVVGDTGVGGRVDSLIQLILPFDILRR